MDKAILKKFAIESRQDLMQKIESKMKLFYVDETFSKQQNGELYVLSNDKHTLSLSKEEYDKRELLIKRIQELGLEQVIEEASYTWFNRIVAIRYMEINDYLPLTKDNQSLGIRVLSSKDNTPDPEIMKFTNLTNPDLDIEFKKEKYIELNTDNEKFKYILLLVCKKLGKVIPQVFDGNTDYIDILIPDNLLNDAGFITKIINDVPEENYNQVEIIGWLYQYYNQTEKDRVISAKKAYKKNEIAYATQLFTPDWIVKYMVENSLGRYWVEHNGDGALYPSDNLYPSNNLYPSSSITDNWKYFIKDNIVKQEEKLKPTEITFIDPCCGSGHILVYAFEVFYQIYIKAGFNKNDIPELILKNNIYGLDIDDRAGQLSILSILLKAREYDKNIFNRRIVRNLNIMSINESNKIPYYIADNILNENIKNQVIRLYENNLNAKEIGSLMNLRQENYEELIQYIENDETIFKLESEQKILPLILQDEILSKKFNVVVTNPPYFKNSSMSEILKKIIDKEYKNYKNDMFAAFIKRTLDFSKSDGYIGLMTPNVWLFISSFENVRKEIILNNNITSMIQLAKGSFFKEATVDICSFILEKSNNNKIGNYIRLESYKGDMVVQDKSFLKELKTKENMFCLNQTEFLKIPGCQIAFWIKNLNIFQFNKIKDLYESGGRNKTHDNNKYLRKWWEISDFKKWQGYANGGEYRKWYGNHTDLVDWSKEAKENYASHGGLYNQKYNNKVGICWNLITSATNGFRIKPANLHYSSGSPTIFPINYEENLYLLAFLNSCVSKYLIDIVNPTLNTTVNDVLNLPLNFKTDEVINQMVNENLLISHKDWDSFETSLDFKNQPLLEFIDRFPGLHDLNIDIGPTNMKIIKNIYNEDIYISTNESFSARIADSYNRWNEYTKKQFSKLKNNEEKINEIFIDTYGLQNELSPIVEKKDITIKIADRIREIKSLISYAVGCMFGRYSLDKKGLIFAGGEFDNTYKKFKEKNDGWAGASLSNYKVLNDNGKEIDLSFDVDNDNVIPITDEAYFADDIVSRFKNFVEIVYGKDTLNENLDYIAETLGKKGTETSEETIRRYFLNDFYSDHIKMYQKKPIYWLFDSGKKNGFKCLIYMHRYNENTVPKVRLDYLHRIQTTYEKLLTDVNYKLATELSLSEKKETQKRQIDLNAKLQEIKEYDEKIAYLANQRINIDLDDGVIVNYAKLQDVLANIK